MCMVLLVCRDFDCSFWIELLKTIETDKVDTPEADVRHVKGCIRKFRGFTSARSPVRAILDTWVGKQ